MAAHTGQYLAVAAAGEVEDAIRFVFEVSDAAANWFTVRACKLGPRPNSYAALTHWQVAHSPIMLYLKSFYFYFFFFFPTR